MQGISREGLTLLRVKAFSRDNPKKELSLTTDDPDYVKYQKEYETLESQGYIKITTIEVSDEQKEKVKIELTNKGKQVDTIL
ncbi:hypothetical protein ACIQ7N_04475 [Lysinibacillus sp. NPDC095746]|uniref:hypothetical protein n=1 Tax=Lysinibacillus sp. NPDC095746 TaxID=3364134 RepID=UPI00380FF8A2